MEECNGNCLEHSPANCQERSDFVAFILQAQGEGNLSPEIAQLVEAWNRHVILSDSIELLAATLAMETNMNAESLCFYNTIIKKMKLCVKFLKYLQAVYASNISWRESLVTREIKLIDGLTSTIGAVQESLEQHFPPLSRPVIVKRVKSLAAAYQELAFKCLVLVQGQTEGGKVIANYLRTTITDFIN